LRSFFKELGRILIDCGDYRLGAGCIIGVKRLKRFSLHLPAESTLDGVPMGFGGYNNATMQRKSINQSRWESIGVIEVQPQCMVLKGQGSISGNFYSGDTNCSSNFLVHGCTRTLCRDYNNLGINILLPWSTCSVRTQSRFGLPFLVLVACSISEVMVTGLFIRFSQLCLSLSCIRRAGSFAKSDTLPPCAERRQGRGKSFAAHNVPAHSFNGRGSVGS
jgi:hypothetical protein